MTVKMRDIWLILAGWWTLSLGTRWFGYPLGADPEGMTRITFFVLALHFHAWVWRKPDKGPEMAASN